MNPASQRICRRPECGKRFKRAAGATRRYCSDACSQWGKAQNQKGRHRVCRSRPFVGDPPITQGLEGNPECHCGKRMDVGTDRLGRTILECQSCGPQTVTIIGTHQYDQRARFEAKLAERQDTVESPVDEKYRRKGIARRGAAGFVVIGRDRQREIEAA